MRSDPCAGVFSSVGRLSHLEGGHWCSSVSARWALSASLHFPAEAAPALPGPQAACSCAGPADVPCCPHPGRVGEARSGVLRSVHPSGEEDTEVRGSALRPSSFMALMSLGEAPSVTFRLLPLHITVDSGTFICVPSGKRQPQSVSQADMAPWPTGNGRESSSKAAFSCEFPGLKNCCQRIKSFLFLLPCSARGVQRQEMVSQRSSL